jgi:bifunctional DNA-binding transcriptional regulator/antitoxin component of YhaV-PrlF toxin-antitoxin module
MKAVEYTTRILANGRLDIPTPLRHELQLRPGKEVKVILLCEEDTPEEKERLAAQRAEAWRKVDEVREQLSGKNFSLTDSLLQAREEEDASL